VLAVELPAELLERALGARAHGLDGDRETPCDLARGKVFEVAEQDRGLVRLVQGEDRLDHGAARGLALEDLGGGREGFVARRDPFGPRARGLAARALRREVPHEGGEPCPQRTAFVRPVLQRREPRLLGHVLGVLAVGDQARGEAPHEPVVREQDLEISGG
jgi:hypothetical protein